jgi:hypothetical protein
MYKRDDLNDRVQSEMARFEARHGKPSPAIETPLTANVRRMAGTVAEASKQIRLSGLSKPEREELAAALNEAVKDELAELLVAERGRVEAEIAKEAKRYARETDLNRLAVEREARAAALRFQAMSAKELAQAANDFITNPRPTPPEVIDSLSLAVKAADPIVFDMLRETVVKENRYEGHRFTETGAKLCKQLRLIDAAIVSGDTVPILHEDGSYHGEDILKLTGVVE